MGRVTNEELASALDEQFGMLAEQSERIEALHERMRMTEGHIRRMVATNERLLAERRTLLEAIAFQRLREVGVRLRAAPEAPASVEPDEFYAAQDLDRYFAELSGH